MKQTIHFFKFTLSLFALHLVCQVTTAQSVMGINLINSTTDQVIRELVDEDTINLMDSRDGKKLNLQAITDPNPLDAANKVKFVIDSNGVTYKTQTEGAAPYAAWGDLTGNYNDGFFYRGKLKIYATPVKTSDGSELGSALTLNLVVVDTIINNNPSSSKDISFHNKPIFSIYPNPVTGIINIELTNSQTVKYIKIIDVNGRVLIEQRDFPAERVQIEINQKIIPGFYFVEVSANTWVNRVKFMKL